MVEMNGFKIPHLPPSIQRFGRCGGTGEEVEDVRQEDGPRASPTTSYVRHGNASSSSTRPLNTSPPAAPLPPTDRVKTFMNGVFMPFAACLQPTVACGGASCAAPDFSRAFKKPAVVTPRHPVVGSRGGQQPPTFRPSNRDSQLSPATVGEEESQYSSHHHHLSPRSDGNGGATSPVISAMKTDNIERPHANDILCGRGGSSNRHQGNVSYRELIAANKKTYVGLTKKQKMMLARQIVDVIKNTDPPGRFLSKDADTGYYYDIGLPRSLEKTSQALREKNSNEIPKQSKEEGVETSVESFQSVINDENENDHSETKQPAGESPESGTTKTKPISNKSPKNVQPPTLIIPDHLMHLYGPDKERRDANSTLSPNGPRSMGPYYHGGSPYRSPYGNQRGPPTPPNPYQSGPHYHHHPAYPPTPPPTGYADHGRYYHHPHHYPTQTPPYGQRPYEDYRRHHPYAAQPLDKREGYSEYYSKSAERDSPNRTDVHGRPHPSPSRYGSRPYPPAHPLAQPVNRGPHGAPPPPLPPSYGRFRAASHGHTVSPPSYRPSSYSGHPPHPHQYPGAPPTPPTLSAPTRDGSAKIIYRTPSNGYVRGNADVSPERQREVKRQRNVDGHIRRVSESSLSSAVRNSLTLEERVVGRERQPSVTSSSNSSAKSISSSSADLMSPSSILQSRSRRSMDGKDKKRISPLSEKEEDYSGLSGLAALSTAAFLKLDEDD